MILITTSDYLPKIGGLSTFTNNIEISLKEIGIPYEVFHWKNIDDLKSFNHENLNKYDLIINVHVMFCWMMPLGHEKMINFIHGSEILMTSSNMIKRIVKKINARSYFEKMNSSYLNLFISKATLNKIKEKGYQVNYSSDLIFHNCIDSSKAILVEKKLSSDELIFTCIVRNVPHKNLVGTVRFCEKVKDLTSKKITLIVPKNSNIVSDKILIEELQDHTDKSRDVAYKNAHFNLLLSLDQSKKGYFEGFGLTVLEAGTFGVPSIVLNTGGLPESVHHKKTGFVIDPKMPIDEAIVDSFQDADHYERLRKDTFEHTINNHSLNLYKRFFEHLVQTRSVS